MAHIYSRITRTAASHAHYARAHAHHDADLHAWLCMMAPAANIVLYHVQYLQLAELSFPIGNSWNYWVV